MRFCCMRQAGDKPRIRVVSCKLNLTTCHARDTQMCGGIMKHVLRLIYTIRLCYTRHAGDKSWLSIFFV